MNNNSSSSAADLLVEMKRSWEENYRFYSQVGEKERERWVVGEFLNRLSVPFVPSELLSHPQHSKVDVEFQQARFQVKEIPDPNCRRSGEIKSMYRRVMNAKTLQETIEPSLGSDVPPAVNGYDLVRDKASELAFSSKYMAHKASLDLLFYVTRTRASVVQMQDIKPEEFSFFGWRSVSCLIGGRALVLYATLEAPTFLRPTP